MDTSAKNRREAEPTYAITLEHIDWRQVWELARDLRDEFMDVFWSCVQPEDAPQTNGTPVAIPKTVPAPIPAEVHAQTPDNVLVA